jgi:D-glycero-D-manno-heptose 1,7-bisphosphate phosphatase
MELPFREAPPCGRGASYSELGFVPCFEIRNSGFHPAFDNPDSAIGRGMSHKAVFLDRDGTLNEEVGYVNHIERFHLLPRVGQAIRLLNQHEWKAVVITNQSGVARGYFPESLVHQIHRKMEELLKGEGAHLDGIYYCPHHPEIGSPPYRQKCQCRKPATGLVEEAVKKLDLDLSRSYVVGDRGADIEFALRIGAKAILVLTGYGRGEWEFSSGQWKVKPDYVAEDLFEAVQWILQKEEPGLEGRGEGVGNPDGRGSKSNDND